MTFSITNSNGTLLLTLQDNVIDNTTFDLAMIGNNTPNFGQFVNQNFIDLLQKFANNTAPPNPTFGELWYDTSTTILKIFNNNSWRILSQPINSLSSNIPTKLTSFNDSGILLTISNDTLVSIYSTFNVSQTNLPNYLLINTKPYQIAPLFSNGIDRGLTLSTNTSILNGLVTVANKLYDKAYITLNGVVYGNVGFDGSQNVTLPVQFNNYYIEGNITVGGIWSNVTVSNNGQIIDGGYIQYNDVINALGYVPINSNAATSLNYSDTLVLRSNISKFAANIISATVQKTHSFTSNSNITISGAAFGVSPNFDSSGNVIINTELAINTNIAPGIYNTIGVDYTGFTQSGQFIDNMPIGSIVLYNQTFIPPGWAVCNGQTVTLPDGYVITTPNLSNAIVGFVNNANLQAVAGSIVVSPNGNIQIPNSNVTVEAVFANNVGCDYIMHIYSDKTVLIGNATPGVLEVNLLSGNIQQIELIGGANIIYPPLVYSGNIVEQSITSEQIVGTFAESVDFGNNPFYSAAALLLSSGDINSVMMCATDIFGDLSQLVVQQILYNLQNRHLQGLPPRLGKYMLSQQDIIDYIGILELPIDTTFFTPALQDELMLLKVSDIQNRMFAANIYPDSAKLFGSVYIGYNQYLAIIQSNSFTTVGAALIQGGYAPTGDAYTDSLFCFQFIESIENLISVAENTIIQNETAIDVISELNSVDVTQSYTVPLSLIQQPVALAGNVYISSNATIITIDGLSNYFGGNINVAPGFGGGAFPYTSAKQSTEYYTNIAKSRYLNPILEFDSNNNLVLSRYTGIGIHVGDNTNTQIGNLATNFGTVNTVVGPISSPQPTQETLQNSFIINRQVTPSVTIQAQSTTIINPPAVQPVTQPTIANTSVNTNNTQPVTPVATPPTQQVTTQYITKTVTYDSPYGSNTSTISYNIVTVGNTIYPDGTTFATSSAYANASPSPNNDIIVNPYGDPINEGGNTAYISSSVPGSTTGVVTGYGTVTVIDVKTVIS